VHDDNKNEERRRAHQERDQELLEAVDNLHASGPKAASDTTLFLLCRARRKSYPTPKSYGAKPVAL
jgi:hypothetical protein